MTLLLYSVRPIVSALMLSSRTRMAPTTSVIVAVRRLYQPDTRSMWPSYQFPTETRNRAMSPLAFADRAWSDATSGDPTGSSCLRDARDLSMASRVVCPPALGTSRSMSASANDVAGM
jgi:hypothetical protein